METVDAPGTYGTRTKPCVICYDPVTEAVARARATETNLFVTLLQYWRLVLSRWYRLEASLSDQEGNR